MDEKEIRGIIESFVATDARNVIPEIPGLAIYEEPLVAFTAADDPMYRDLKKEGIIGPHHLLPSEWLAGAKSVVVLFSPLFKGDNRQQ